MSIQFVKLAAQQPYKKATYMDFIPDKKLGFGLMRLPQDQAHLVASVLDTEQIILLKGSRLAQFEPFWLPLLLTRNKSFCSKAADCPKSSPSGCLCS